MADTEMRKISNVRAGMRSEQYPPAALAWFVWGLGAALFLVGFFYRVAPGVMTAELMNDFSITAAALGNLAAFYFYSYVFMQIPTGLLADSWGSRRLLTVGALVAGIGSVIFALAGTMLWASFGRLLVGGAVAVAFVAMMKLSSLWMVPRQFALASGMALFLGIIGAVFAGTPLRLLIIEFGWRPVMLFSSLIPFALALLIWTIVRDDPRERGYKSHAPISTEKMTLSAVMSGLKKVIGYRNTWLLTIAPGAHAGSVLAFAGLWGIPYLTTHYSMEVSTAAAVCSAMLLAWAVGGPLCGSLSERMGRRKPLYVTAGFCLTSGWLVMIFFPGMPIVLLVGVLLFIGLSAGGVIIGFAFVKESVPTHLSGTAAGVCNMGNMLGPMLLQPAAGFILDQQWQGAIVDGVRVYGIGAYQAGFAIMVAWGIVSTVSVALCKETCNRNIS